MALTATRQSATEEERLALQSDLALAERFIRTCEAVARERGIGSSDREDDLDIATEAWRRLDAPGRN